MTRITSKSYLSASFDARMSCLFLFHSCLERSACSMGPSTDVYHERTLLKRPDLTIELDLLHACHIEFGSLSGGSCIFLAQVFSSSKTPWTLHASLLAVACT